jgi:predicted TIM-barrel fold metal-dependent hydrolase
MSISGTARRSLRAYEAQLKTAGREVAGVGAMWFGGPNQALQGHPEQVQVANDGLIALAARYPKIMPIATVHSYDGPAAVAELERVAARGFKVLKLHPR